ncbi:unnamed protein product [Allacma fusca]|uniref:Uncharacterized protein n=1 Tax=Allacma fusca TaxID=39272 RepID=A0A8J2KA58_9HEXA|nr:unnamed protein product [Allacma fusca]
MSVTTTPSSSSSSVTTAITNSTTRETPSTSSTSRASVGKLGSSTEEKILNRYTGILLADGSQKKLEMADHLKRLAYLRKEADQLEKTDWQYEPVEKLLGK